MSIDFESSDERKQYLTDKLDDLLEGISESYGTLLMEELIARLELTIKDFNDEMKDLCSQLVKKEKERQQLLDMLKSKKNNQLTTQSQSTGASNQANHSNDLDEEDVDVPEWEKKLAKLEKK